MDRFFCSFRRNLVIIRRTRTPIDCLNERVDDWISKKKKVENEDRDPLDPPLHSAFPFFL